MEKPIIRPFTESDFENISIFLEQQTNKHIKKEIWEKLFIKWWIKNPFNPTAQTSGHIIESGGEVKGFHCYFKSTKEINGKYIDAYNASSWDVDESTRKYSLGVIKSFFSEKRPGILINSTPTPQVRKIYESFKFSVPKDNASDFFSIMPINLTFFIKDIFNRKLNTLKFIYKLLTPVIKPLSILYSLYLHLITKNSVEIKSIHNFDDFKKTYSSEAIQNLNWIFNPKLDPYYTDRRIIKLEKGSKLIGHAIFNIYTMNDLNYSYLVDFNIIEEKLRKDCLRAIVKYQISLNVSYFRFTSVQGTQSFNLPLLSFKNNKPSYLFKYTKELTERPDNLRLTALDGDQVHFVC